SAFRSSRRTRSPSARNGGSDVCTIGATSCCASSPRRTARRRRTAPRVRRRRRSTADPEFAAPAATSRACAAYALGLLTLINRLSCTDRNVVFALFEPIKRELVVSDQQLGWLGSAYVVVLSLFALPLGVVGDLKSRRAVIAFGVGLWSACTALGAAVGRFWQLLLCRALVGVGEAGYGPAAQALIAELFRGRRRAFAIGIYSVGMAFGGVLGIWLGGVLAERHGPIAVRGTSEATGVAATAFGDFLQASGTVLRTPTLIWMFVGGALVTFAVNGLIAWAPSFLERTHGLSVATIGRQFGVWGLAGGALGALFGGRTGDWLLARWSGGRVVVSGAGFVLGGPVCAALLLIDELRLFVPLLFGTFFLYSWYNGPLSAVILDVVPAAVRASVLGAFVLFSHLAGDAIAPPLNGYLSDRFGLRAAMLLLPTAGAVGGVVILIALTTVGRDMQRVRT